MSSNWSSLCVTTIRTIMTSSMIVFFAFLVLSFVIRLLMCTHRLQIWHHGFHGRDCYKVFESDVIDDWDEVACCHIKEGQRNTISTGPLYSRCKSQRQNGNIDNKVLAIALRYTAASVFRTGDSLTPFGDSISAFKCRSARLTGSRSFGCLSRLRPCWHSIPVACLWVARLEVTASKRFGL